MRIGGSLGGARIRIPPKIPNFPKQKVKGWINIFQSPDGHFYAGKIHPDTQSANHKMIYALDELVARIPIEFFTGQGIQTDK